ncbi:hypothetical protein ACWEFL_06720 [Streptomyces sp. NPDC004838]
MSAVASRASFNRLLLADIVLSFPFWPVSPPAVRFCHGHARWSVTFAYETGHNSKE